MSTETMGLPATNAPTRLGPGPKIPGSSPVVTGTLDMTCSAFTMQMNTVGENGTPRAGAATLTYGCGCPMTGGGGVLHTSGKQRFSPTPRWAAGSMGASYPR